MLGTSFVRKNSAVKKGERVQIFNLLEKNRPEAVINAIKGSYNEEQKEINDYLGQFVDQDNLEEFLKKIYDPNHAGNVDHFYKDIPEKEMFRLFVDVRKQRKERENGFVGYETREPGCIQAMYDAFQCIAGSINEPLSTEYIKKIHSLAATKCKPFIDGIRGYDVIYSSINPGEFKDNNGATVGMENSSISPLGILDMYENYSKLRIQKTNPFKFVSEPIEKPYLVLVPFQKCRAEYESQINTFILDYEKEVLDPLPLNKIVAIIRLFQRLDRQHAFRDANTRTYETLLLNKELVKHGFMPSLLEDPGRFTGHTLNECVYEVLRGMQNFQELKEHGSIEGCIHTDVILSKKHKLPISSKLG